MQYSRVFLFARSGNPILPPPDPLSTAPPTGRQKVVCYISISPDPRPHIACLLVHPLGITHRGLLGKPVYKPGPKADWGPGEGGEKAGQRAYPLQPLPPSRSWTLRPSVGR